jgi:hypothetical protein
VGQSGSWIPSWLILFSANRVHAEWDSMSTGQYRVGLIVNRSIQSGTHCQQVNTEWDSLSTGQYRVGLIVNRSIQSGTHCQQVNTEWDSTLTQLSQSEVRSVSTELGQSLYHIFKSCRICQYC